MIFDRLHQRKTYEALHPLFGQAFDFIVSSGELPAGRYDLDAAGMYALVKEYTTRPAAEKSFEAHRVYIDIQVLMAGQEIIEIAPHAGLQAGEYDPKRDLQPLQGTGQPLVVREGEFVILFPQDAHKPDCQVDGPLPVRKVIVKVPVLDDRGK